MADDDHIFRSWLSHFRGRSRATGPIVSERAHRIRATHGRGAVRMSGGGIQGFHTSPLNWRCSLSKPRHGGVAFVMEFSAGGRVASDLPSNALHCSCNARRLLVHGRRCRDAGIAAASFHFPVAIVAFDSHPPVRSGKRWRRLTLLRTLVPSVVGASEPRRSVAAHGRLKPSIQPSASAGTPHQPTPQAAATSIARPSRHVYPISCGLSRGNEGDGSIAHSQKAGPRYHTNLTCTVGALCAQQTRTPPEGDAHVTIIGIRVSRNPCALSAACRKRHPP